MKSKKFYIALISVHGLIRGKDLELGRDADTGGQVKYVIELARSLINHPSVRKVDIITRKISDPKVSHDYAQTYEPLDLGATIVRLPCGPKRYFRKETLWPYLDGFTDNIMKYFRSIRDNPDVVHGHYADAGYVGSRLGGLLGIPFVFTGHSLGREKKRRLLDQGMKAENIEEHFRISRRIEAEETALDHAAFVVASTRQEIEEQYEQYDYYRPQRMLQIPPGIDTHRFKLQDKREIQSSPITKEIMRFLNRPQKAMILAMARADAKKNLATLIHAYGKSESLQQKANLVLVAGCRDDLHELDKGAQQVINEILYLIDRYDLYGKVAYPKKHRPEDVPHIYHLAKRSRGLFVNPAFTEPFGLTLIEAAACGLPIIATNDGGPREILKNCNNGQLIDPLDIPALSETLENALTDSIQWNQWSRNGIKGVKQHYSWVQHSRKYMQAVKRVTVEHNRSYRRHRRVKGRLMTMDRLLVSDVDNTLIGNKAGLKHLMKRLEEVGDRVGFGIATGRSLELAVEALNQWNIPIPDLIIASVGSEIYFGPNLVQDWGWKQHISYRWNPEMVNQVLSEIPGLKRQPEKGQGSHKISYYIDPTKAPSEKEVQRILRKQGISVRTIFSHGMFLDILPIRASKGRAVRYFALKWDLPLERILVAGDSGNDGEMLTGNTLGVVVGNYSEELESLKGDPGVYFANQEYANGILEGLEHYQFLNGDKEPKQEFTKQEVVA